MKTVYVVVGDLGSAKELLLAKKEISSRDVSVKWFADITGKARDLLKRSNVVFEERGPNQEDCPDLLLIGTSATAVAAQIAWTTWGRMRNIPVLWLEDIWGCGELLTTRVVSPDAMLVNDGMAADIARSVRPNLETIIVGKATFESLLEMAKNAEQIRKRAREKLGVGIGEFLVSYMSGGFSSARVREHLQALSSAPEASYGFLHSSVFTTRLHPKLPEDEKPELDNLLAASGKRTVGSYALSLDELTVASEVVVTDWGCTEGYRSFLLGVPTIVTLFPDDLERRLGAGYPEGVPPLVRSRSVEGAKSARDLRDILCGIDLLRRAMADITTKNRQPYSPLLQPGASNRVADAVMEYIR